jgi:glyoxylase-like metal-dependent hydrolase (beta-lactamase superfamily II)
MFKFNTDNIGYVLLEPSTRSLIAIDLGEFEISHKVITEIESSQRAKLKYILTTHHHGDH